MDKYIDGYIYPNYITKQFGRIDYWNNESQKEDDEAYLAYIEYHESLLRYPCPQPHPFVDGDDVTGLYELKPKYEYKMLAGLGNPVSPLIAFPIQPQKEETAHEKSLRLLDEYLKNTPQEEIEKIAAAIGNNFEGPTLEEYFAGLSGRFKPTEEKEQGESRAVRISLLEDALRAAQDELREANELLDQKGIPTNGLDANGHKGYGKRENLTLPQRLTFVSKEQGDNKYSIEQIRQAGIDGELSMIDIEHLIKVLVQEQGDEYLKACWDEIGAIFNGSENFSCYDQTLMKLNERFTVTRKSPPQQ